MTHLEDDFNFGIMQNLWPHIIFLSLFKSKIEPKNFGIIISL